MRTLLLAIAISLLALSAAPRDAFAQRGGGHGPPQGGSYHGGGGSYHGRGGSHHGGDHHHGSSWWGPRFSIGIGPGYWWGAPGYWWGAPYYGYPYSYSLYAPLYPYWQRPTRVIVEDPPVYIERNDVDADAPPERSWYYCETKRAYYPKVRTCPEPWIPVPPRD